MIADSKLIAQVVRLQGKVQGYYKLQSKLQQMNQEIRKECEDLNEIFRKKPMDEKCNKVVVDIFNKMVTSRP